MDYLEVPVEEAYSLLNCGGMIIVCTRSQEGRYDLAPIAWSCPLDYEPVSRILFVCDTGHATWDNLRASREFAVALPSYEQRELIERSGAVSGRGLDKYESLGLSSFPAAKVDTRIPDGVAAWLECSLIRTIEEGTSSIVLGEVVAARALPEAWKKRLHYLSEGLAYAPGAALD
jgi:flavin reductase (DIM6/NTAB) family NADH-FMN oxidoreductase RutF